MAGQRPRLSEPGDDRVDGEIEATLRAVLERSRFARLAALAESKHLSFADALRPSLSHYRGFRDDLVRPAEPLLERLPPSRLVVAVSERDDLHRRRVPFADVLDAAAYGNGTFVVIDPGREAVYFDELNTPTYVRAAGEPRHTT